MAWILLAAPICTAPLVALLWAVDRPLLVRLADEDGAFEWLQVVFFGLALVAALASARRLLATARPVLALLYLVLAAGLFFVAGEELAWGQRLIPFDTPEALAAVNHKGEASLHNISSLTSLFALAKLAAGLYGTLGVLLLRGLARRRDVSALELVVVPPFLTSPFAIVLGMRLLRLTVMRNVLPAGYAEYEELILAAGLALFTALVWHRVSGEASTGVSPRRAAA